MAKYITHTFLVAPPDFTGNPQSNAQYVSAPKDYPIDCEILENAGNMSFLFLSTIGKEVLTKYFLKRGISSKCGSAVITWME